MQMERTDADHYTEIALWNEPRAWHTTYTITCMDVDTTRNGERLPPTARIALLTWQDPTPENVRRLAAEYIYVADVAEALQAEKRAAYDALLEG